MIQFDTCCCCFSLRIGSLILLWIILASNVLNALGGVASLFMVEGENHVAISTRKIMRILFYMISNIIGIIVAILGIYAISNNVPKYLTASYFYLFYEAFLLCVAMVLFIVSPFLYYEVIGDIQILDEPRTQEMVVTTVFTYLVLIVLSCYFALILRSYRDEMIKKNKHNTSENPSLSATANSS